MPHNDKHIDQFIADKANAFKADNSMLLNDFAALQNALPKAPTTTIAPKTNPLQWFSANSIIVAVTTVVVLIGGYYLYNNNKQQPKQNIIAQSISTKDSIPTNTIDTDTPVVLTEMPKDPTKAPKKWVYRMQINFDKKTNTVLPKKKFINLQDVDDQKQIAPTNTKEAKEAVQNFMSQLKEPSQIFTIKAEEAHFITAKNGTTFTIAPNSFTTADGKLITGDVALEVREAYNYSDVVANNLHTLSNGNLLQSGGMLYMNATQNNVPLAININNPIQVTMPTTNKKDSMQLFNLVDNNWVANGQWQGNTRSSALNRNSFTNSDVSEPKNDTLPNTSRIKGIAPTQLQWRTRNRIDNKTTILKDSLGFITYSSISTIIPARDSLIQGGNINNILYNEIGQGYNYSLRNLGWINCDRFSNEKDIVPIFYVKNKQNNNLNTSFLLFPQINSMLLSTNENTDTYFRNIPNNKNVTYIAFAKKDNKILTCIQQMNTADKFAKAENFIELTPAQVKAKLDALGSLKD